MLIARSILPSDDRPSQYSIEPFDTAIHFSPRRKMRKDIVLAIDIVRRGAFDGPIDACETRCLREMEEKLTALGARAEHW